MVNNALMCLKIQVSLEPVVLERFIGNRQCRTKDLVTSIDVKQCKQNSVHGLEVKK